MTFATQKLSVHPPAYLQKKQQFFWQKSKSMHLLLLHACPAWHFDELHVPLELNTQLYPTVLESDVQVSF